MRLTAIFNAVNRRVYRNRKKDGHNQIKLAKFLWHHGSKRKVLSTGEKDLLTSKGFKVWSPDEFISKPYETPKYEDYFPPPIKEEKPRLEPLYRLDSDFLPLLSKCTDLMQHLSWSVIVDSLPASITERQRQLTTAERRLIEECILSSHLLDGVMDPLPLTENYELPNRIEKPRRVDMPHGIPVARKNMLLTQGLLKVFDDTGLDPLQALCRPHILQSGLVCNLRYSGPADPVGELLQVRLTTPLLVGVWGAPLPPVLPAGACDRLVLPPAPPTRGRGTRVEAPTDPLTGPLPDIGPMLPYIGSTLVDNYNLHPTTYCSSAVHPHTVHIHHNAPCLYSPYTPGLNTHQLTALTLLNLYAHALTHAVASNAKIDEHGHLEQPIVVQGVHSHVNMFQPAVFQLNTVGPNCLPLINQTATANNEASNMASDVNKMATDVNKMAPLPQLDKDKMAASSGVRNAFLYRPFEELYMSCDYDETGKPSLKGVNYELVECLRAVHES